MQFFFFLYSFLIYYILTAVSPSFSNPTSRLPHIHYPSEKSGSLRDKPNMAYQVSVRLGTNSHTKAGRRNPIGEKGYQK